MFIALVRFPEVPTDRDVDFQDWFTWSSQQLAGAEGLRSRRLLRSPDGQYSALVEHESAATFAAMHAAPIVARIQARLLHIVPEQPHSTQFHVIAESSAEPVMGPCCADGGTAEHDHRPQPAAGGEASTAQHTCCHAG